MYFTPDLTAQDALYRVDNDVRIVMVNNQKILFGAPIYKHSINMMLLGTSNTPLLMDVDFTIEDDDIDYEAMGRMKLLTQGDFTYTLVKSLTIQKAIVSDIKINISYQKLYPVMSKVAIYNDEVFNVTPDVLRDLIAKVNYLYTLTTPVSQRIAISSSIPKLLELDPFMSLNENKIDGEIHDINVPANRNFIHPVCGAFYKNTETVKVVASGEYLRKDIDYKVCCVDLTKTKNTTNPDGVYNYILILLPFVGQLEISYHAYGGEPTLYDVRSIDESLQNVVAHLNDADFLTTMTLKDTKVITNILNKIMLLESEMRRLANSGRPSYGDVTNGSTLMKKITASDTKLHWWTIASLYKVDKSDTVFLADRFRFRFKSVYTKFMFDAAVSVDLTNKSMPFDVTIFNATYPIGYVPFENYDDVDYIIRPQFRIIWNDNDVEASGIILQVGMELKTVSEETLLIEDISGIESCWIMTPEVVESVLPEDDIIVLPNTNHIWSEDNISSKKLSCLLPFPKGHLVWAGGISLNRPASGWQYYTLDHFLDNNVNIETFKKVRLELSEDGGDVFPVEISFIPGLKRLVGTVTFTYDTKPAIINVRIYRDDVTENIKIELDANIEIGVISPELSLHHVIVFS